MIGSDFQVGVRFRNNDTRVEYIVEGRVKAYRAFRIVCNNLASNVQASLWVTDEQEVDWLSIIPNDEASLPNYALPLPEGYGFVTCVGGGFPVIGVGEIPSGGLTPHQINTQTTAQTTAQITLLTTGVACTCPSLFRDGHTNSCAHYTNPTPIPNVWGILAPEDNSALIRTIKSTKKGE